ncbi:hypothetical protein [Phytobacter ursingii]|jgi:hypothetical protein|uniref:Uncharacterized protein n=1 Tax=Phytobacter ursingii TaxID=1972431 RepID=A0AB35RVL1_9ENTR|nr:hypothetical protein [Phytobacter ursingii]MDV2865611.1 hypothetical protein [Phytobacter ursingii]
MGLSNYAYALISLVTVVPLATFLLLGIRIGKFVYLTAFIEFSVLLFSYAIFRFTYSQFEIIGPVFIGLIAINYIIGIVLRIIELRSKWGSRTIPASAKTTNTL